MRGARHGRGSRLCRDRQQFYHAHDHHDTVYDDHDSEHNHPGASVPAGRLGLGLGVVLGTDDLTPRAAPFKRRP
jgi:hypothetical protein